MNEKNKNSHIHISAKRKWYDLNLKEVWQYKDLIWLFTKRNFTLIYKQTILGPAWIFLNPFITSVIYTFVFGKIAGIQTDGIPQILFYMCSNAIWAFFASCVNTTANSFRDNAHVFGKVYFPRLTIPISNMLVAGIRFFIQFLMIAILLVFFLIRGEVSPNWELLPVILILLLHLGVMGLGVGIIISSLTTKYRDLSLLVGFGVQLWMYATPIVYPLSQLGQSTTRTLLMLNPVTMPVEAFRYILLGKGTIDLSCFIISSIFTIIVAILGLMIFNHVEKTFMDTV